MAEKYGKKVRELMVKEMKDIFDHKKGFIFTNFENIKASDFDRFRQKVKTASTRFLIVRKRLGRMALEDAGLLELETVFDENKNIGLIIVEDDPVAVAKLLKEFSKENKGFEVSSGYLEGRVLSQEKIKELADLPGREQLLAMVVGTLNAPISGFVGVLAAVLRSFCCVLNAYKDKKETGN